MSTAEITAAQTLDCKGLNCPVPILKTSTAIKKIAVGEILEMLATDPGSVADMAAWSKRTGHEIVAQNEEDGLYTYYVRRTK